MSTTDAKKEPEMNRASIVNAVQTPLGFFALTILVVEVIFGTAANFSSGNNRDYLIWSMIGLIFTLVAIVTALSFFRPEALSGIRPKKQESDKTSDISAIPLPTPTPTPTSAPLFLNSTIKFYASIKDAKPDIIKICKEATSIRILANKGIVFLGTDDSIISTAEILEYKNLHTLRAILLSSNSKSINKGFVSLRQHESIEFYKKELEASHKIVESGVKKLQSKVNTRSGIKYFQGEPCWRIIMTEQAAFVSSYADEHNLQIRDVPVLRFDNTPSSFYAAYKRHFDNVWKNESTPGAVMKEIIDFTVSAGGIVYTQKNGASYIVLVQRHDGLWVLPKGHKTIEDGSIENTATREVSEETGINSSFLHLEENIDTYSDNTHEPKIVHIFAIKYTGEQLIELTPDEDHLKTQWFDISKKIPELFYPQQKIILSNFMEKLKIKQ